MTGQKAKKTDANRTHASNDVVFEKFVAPAVLDMRVVRRLKSDLDNLYGQKLPCEIHLQGVEKVSTGCLQLFAAFVRTMHAAKLPVSLMDPSAPFKRGAEDLGLDAVFSLYSREA